MATQLDHVDGVMIGREAYHNPWLLADIDRRFYGADAGSTTREDILEAFIPFAEQEINKGVRLGHMTRHILGLYNGQPGARKFRRFLSENAPTRQGDSNLLREAISLMESWAAESEVKEAG